LPPTQATSEQTGSRHIVHRDAIAVAEAVSSLELERSIFDSAETEILSAAFAKAWTYVEFDPSLGMLEAWERQSELARSLMAILKLGDSNPISIANSAIVLMRKTNPESGNRRSCAVWRLGCHPGWRLFAPLTAAPASALGDRRPFSRFTQCSSACGCVASRPGDGFLGSFAGNQSRH